MTLGRFTVGALVFAFLLLGGGTVERADAAGQPFQELWGDLNCNGEVQSGDALHVLRHVAGLTVFIPEGICDTQMGMFPDTLLQIEGGRQVQWADVDCSGKVTAVDTLRILRFVAGLPNTVAAGCPEIGAMTTLSIAQ